VAVAVPAGIYDHALVLEAGILFAELVLDSFTILGDLVGPAAGRDVARESVSVLDAGLDELLGHLIRWIPVRMARVDVDTRIR